METLALIIFLLPIVGGAIYFLALLVQGEISLPSIPPSLHANQSSAVTQNLWEDMFEDSNNPEDMSSSQYLLSHNELLSHNDVFIHHYHDD